ncbi:MAG: YbjQ family protein [Alloprevotella sp.]
MLLTTTHSIEGRPVTRYCGIVSSEVIIGANFVKDIFASFRDFFGGRSKAYEDVLAEAKEKALTELSQKAERCGANAVVGIKLDYETVGASGSMLMVVASGTAVVI